MLAASVEGELGKAVRYVGVCARSPVISNWPVTSNYDTGRRVPCGSGGNRVANEQGNLATAHSYGQASCYLQGEMTENLAIQLLRDCANLISFLIY